MTPRIAAGLLGGPALWEIISLFLPTASPDRELLCSLSLMLGAIAGFSLTASSFWSRRRYPVLREKANLLVDLFCHLTHAAAPLKEIVFQGWPGRTPRLVRAHRDQRRTMRQSTRSTRSPEENGAPLKACFAEIRNFATFERTLRSWLGQHIRTEPIDVARRCRLLAERLGLKPPL